ncbi:unnamed protein product [Nesidiocoris tenuis]|uniref:Sulfatase N-terminal domain-containing protein n=1 Tax=Nesidiocoris tenuis TaxID=355587 RepID=A0A6H5GI58_9HEMI|nr:unnamed protein product [Nesidiocoris tenuis]
MTFPCHYSEIQRPSNDGAVIYGPYKELHDSGAVPETDFIYVECDNIFGIPLYSDFYAYARKNLNIRDYESDSEVSVAMIGLDSMSRVNFMRQMPLTYEYVTNHFPNKRLGVRVSVCGDSQPVYVRFIWDEFADAGAVTTYAEDWPNHGTFQLAGRSGFLKQPTNHYMHTFYRALQDSFKEKLDMPHCLSARPIHSHHLTYLLSIFRAYRNSPSFMFSLHNGMTHDSFNLPQLMDADLRDFLRTAYESGFLNRTVLILYGDHGQRIDSVRTTEGGRIEDLMPLMSFVLPENLDPAWKTNLSANRNRLTSNFDIYPTLVDILGTLGPFEDKVKNLQKEALGRSLFSEVDKNRTCEQAHIEDRFCSCANDLQTSLPTTMDVCQKSAESWIARINGKFVDGTICSTLSLKDVSSCKRTSNPRLNTMYHVTFRTTPGDAVFESTSLWGETMTSLGEISRIDRYDKQSFCVRPVDDFTKKMREFCFCK